ncbi:PX-associated-domain-containing protein [Podospora appendiculata]|uniref:PX-associated-domain-containing protein n=1 Tax=Podospora appendiculata TaxID=314037 RepID=A0AAE1C7Z9_9PEZI|nr:PX-associated-domain-containing protein [Podospora appendiculata]
MAPADGTRSHPSASPTPAILTSVQLHALFDILTHHETYAEVERFKQPSCIANYGYPFSRPDSDSVSDGSPLYAAESSAPLLAGLLRRIVLPVPGVRDLPGEFWHVRFQGILSKLSEAELSESYDKGALGTRKTLATAASAIHEYVTRGILGGIARGPKRKLDGSYDRSKADDLVRAFEDVVHELVYGDLVDELFECATEKKSLEEHSPAVQAAVDYIIIHIAAFMYHVFVLSTEGPYLLKLVDNVHKLVPYTMLKQTLRIGNAGSMLNSVMKLLLAKMGVGAISNWVGLTTNADDGMNLLQRIIWLVLSWDSSEFRRSADKIERAKGGPSKEQLAAIKRYVDKPRTEHEKVRQASKDSPTSIIASILQDASPDLLISLSETQHAQCHEYFSALVAIQDREAITKVLCRQNPDLFTQAIRDFVASFEPMIRAVHERVDLREHLSAAEGFLSDFISVSKGRKIPTEAKTPTGRRSPTGRWTPTVFLSSTTTNPSKPDAEIRPPSTEDYVGLLRKNRHLLYNWLHKVASQCPQIRDDFHDWAKKTVKIFGPSKQPSSTSAADAPCKLEEAKIPESSVSSTSTKNPRRRQGAAGALSSNLQALFASLPASTRVDIIATVDAHASHLFSLEDLSLQRMQSVLDKIPADSAPEAATDSEKQPQTAQTATVCGPGMFIARWQHLLDATLITPKAPDSTVRSGKDVKGSLMQGKAVSTAARDGGWDIRGLMEMAERENPSPPQVEVVVETLGPAFRVLVLDLLVMGHGETRS